MEQLTNFLNTTGFYGATMGTIIMIVIGLLFIYLGVCRKTKPMLLISIGVGIIIGNIGVNAVVFDEFGLDGFSILKVIGFDSFLLPMLVFLGLGTMIDFSGLIAKPKLVLIGIAAQLGIFLAFMAVSLFGNFFNLRDAAAIAIIGSGDAISALFVATSLWSDYFSVIVIVAILLIALVPTIQKPIMRMLTTDKERVIKMTALREVSQKEKIIFACAGLVITGLLVPQALPLLGMLFFGNLLKVCGVIKSTGNTFTSIMLIVIGLLVGIAAQAGTFLTWQTVLIFLIGGAAFKAATMSGIWFVKLMNCFLKDGNKINPLIGNAGVSVLPDAAQLSEEMGLEYDKSNHLFSHAMGATAASIIGSALVAGILIQLLG
jgi:oxaloacetate decarboxylase beta subunit